MRDRVHALIVAVVSCSSELLLGYPSWDELFRASL